jgi:ATP-binding cassette subfamily B protein RaxB
VLQDDALFSGSICENIAFFDSEIDMARVQAAARDAQVHDEIMALPMGYSSLISDMGSTLSGGQRQRVLLARALYRDPLVIFLDEGTAHLDGDSERRVMASLRALDRTRIVVAHREAAIAGADRIFLVAGGHVTEVTAPVDHAILEIDDVGA